MDGSKTSHRVSKLTFIPNDRRKGNKSKDLKSVVENDATYRMMYKKEKAARDKRWISSSYDDDGNVVGRVGAEEWLIRMAKREQAIIDEHKAEITKIENQISGQDTIVSESKESAGSATGGASTEGYHALAEDLGISVGSLVNYKNIFK